MIFLKLTQLPYSNGLVHMLDDVLLPNRGSYFIYLTNNLVVYQQSFFVFLAKNLLELAQSERLNTFLELVKIGGLEEAFSKFGPYTIFIPSEAAFYCKFDWQAPWNRSHPKQRQTQNI